MNKKKYIYPQNLKAAASLWMWSMRDFEVICIALLLAAVMLVVSHLVLPMALTACFAFLTIRTNDTTIMDYIRYAVRYFVSVQQYYEWRENR